MKDGEFLLKLEEDTLVLRATPHALRTILVKYGGIKNILQKIYMIEEEAMFDLIVAALNTPEANVLPKAPGWKQTLRDNIFSAGLINLVDPLTAYVMLLANGGKHQKEQGDDEDDSGKA